jgi:OFA family oxalate/formate antiporter-like MFS transporter
MSLALGSIYAWSLFVPVLQREMGLSREQASGVFSVALASVAICFLSAGRLQDLKGPYLVSMISSVLIGAGYVLCSRARSVLELQLSCGVVIGAAVGFGYASPIAVASKWFPQRRGLIIGLLVAAFGAGSAVLGPIVPAWIETHGWRSMMWTLGVVYFAATVIGAQFVRNPPAGWAPPAGAVKAGLADYGPGQVLRTSQYWRILAAYALGASAGLMVISQVAPFVRGAVPAEGPALVGTVLLVGAAGNACGRFFSGWLSDYLGRVRTLCLMLLLSAAILPLLGRVHTPQLLLGLLLLVYYCYGTQLSVYASLTADLFGARNVGANYGLVFLGLGLAGIIGPKLGGAIFDRYQSYTLAFDIAAVLLLLALASIATVRAPRARVG